MFAVWVIGNFYLLSELSESTAARRHADAKFETSPSGKLLLDSYIERVHLGLTPLKLKGFHHISPSDLSITAFRADERWNARRHIFQELAVRGDPTLYSSCGKLSRYSLFRWAKSIFYLIRFSIAKVTPEALHFPDTRNMETFLLSCE